MRYEVGQANRLGNRRQNEDRAAIVETQEGVLLVLADGMGGHQSGEVAAQTLVDLVSRYYRQAHRPLTNPARFFQQAFLDAHAVLLDLARRRNYQSLPGTTAVAAVIEDGHLHWAHVGDSRLYIFRNGLPLFRTRDHSYVEQLYQQGRISLSEQAHHPKRNQITQCIGCQSNHPAVEVGRSRVLSEGDIVLLCSDGLWESLDDAQIGNLIASTSGKLGRVIDHLAGVAEASAYPNSDNISVLALRFISRPARERARVHEHDPEEIPLLTNPLEGRSGEDLKDAIDAIERVFREYQDELKQ